MLALDREQHVEHGHRLDALDLELPAGAGVRALDGDPQRVGPRAQLPSVEWRFLKVSSLKSFGAFSSRPIFFMNAPISVKPFGVVV